MVKITDVLHFLDKRDIRYTFTGENTFSFENFCPLNAPTKKSITWIRHAETLDVGKLNAVNGLLLAAEYGSDIRGAKFPILYVPNVHRTFFRLLERFFPEWDPDRKKPGIASSAVVETDKIGEGVYIGHHTYVGPEAEIGDHVTILNNVSIHGRVSIGDHTIIESGSSIGVCGFGQYWDEDGTHEAQMRWPGLPVLCSGGVASNRQLRAAMERACGAVFAQPQYSVDNALGVAILTRRALERGAGE